MQELIKNIEQWAKDRNIDEQGTVEAQATKTCEEMAELVIGISKDNVDMIKDAIGDVFVTVVIGNMLQDQIDMEKMLDDVMADDFGFMIGNLYHLSILMVSVTRYQYSFKTIRGILLYLKIIAGYYDLTLQECVQEAYNEIKDRKGKMIDGQFVKEEDLKL